jgi:tRNA(adenine34) deaminase
LGSGKDEQFMKAALEEARKALEKEEVPIGAVLVANQQIIARGHNRSIILNDPSAHAEIIALRQGGKVLGNYRLTDTAVYVTVEPCIMCMGALVQARIKRLVFGARDPRAGAAGSVFDFSRDERLNHKIETAEGILEKECRTLIQSFFSSKRQKLSER